MERHLRPATSTDVPAVAAIWWEGWQEAHSGRVPEELVAARTRESFDVRAGQRVADTVVAVSGGEVVGFVMSARDEVEQVFVAPVARGTHIAARLLDAGGRAVLARGHSRAWLAVVPGNDRARAFYEREGWRDTGDLAHEAPVGDRSVTVACRRYVRDVSPLVSVAELSERLAEVTVLDVRYRAGAPPGREEYAAGHVPGAVFVDMDTDLADPPGDGGRHPLPDPGRFGAAMAAAGVSQRRPVVVYDDWAGHAASRAWWLLRHHGHRDVRVLDGGWSAWVAAGEAVSTDDPHPEPGDYVAGPATLPVVGPAEAGWVDVLVDARAPERFRGETEPLDPVAGHIPAAVNVPSSANLDDTGRFRSAAELRELYAAVGAVPGADVAAYCGSGVTACHDVLALELAGVRAALYPGSWSGWIADPSRPVATGE